jgi:hypothetical protein
LAAHAPLIEAATDGNRISNEKHFREAGKFSWLKTAGVRLPAEKKTAGIFIPAA